MVGHLTRRVAFACALASAQPVAARAADIGMIGDDRDSVQAGLGAFAAVKHRDIPDRAAEARIEYRFGRKLWRIGPLVGLMANGNGGLFAYGALYLDAHLGAWAITPAAGGGFYSKGEGKDLGGEGEFMWSFDVAYMLAGGSRLGVKLAHISNGNTQDRNPGTESLLLTYTMPTEWFSRR